MWRVHVGEWRRWVGRVACGDWNVERVWLGVVEEDQWGGRGPLKVSGLSVRALDEKEAREFSLGAGLVLARRFSWKRARR